MSGPPWAGKWSGSGPMYRNVREIVSSHWAETFEGTEYRECVACQREWPCAAYRLAEEVLDMLVIPQ